MQTQVMGFLLDESQGEFKDEKDGRMVKYHNARIYDTVESKLIKVSVPDDADPLPDSQVPCIFVITVDAGEKWCRLKYDHFKPAPASK